MSTYVQVIFIQNRFAEFELQLSHILVFTEQDKVKTFFHAQRSN